MRRIYCHRDYRFYALLIAWCALIAGFIKPTIRQSQAVYHYTLIIDITRSMNAEDYREGEQPVSRLTFVKHQLQALLKELPCQSRVGLGVFTERRTTLLFQPIEVCQGYNELNVTLASLDWRMAWAADSRIASGLQHALTTLPTEPVIFITDGHEAPPLNPRYQADFSALKGKKKGVILGVGDLALTAIPKFNAQGQREGVYQADDVPQRSTFGESDLNPEKIPGYNARNAPFGNEAVVGNEHLTSLKQEYLQSLAAQSGLVYQRLTDSDSLKQALFAPELAQPILANVDIRWRYALAAGLLLISVYVPFISFSRRWFRR